MIKLTNEKLQAIVEQSSEQGEFCSIYHDQDFMDLYPHDLGYRSAEDIERVTFEVMEEIIECQDNDRDLRLKLANNYLARISESVHGDLSISWDQSEERCSSDIEKTSKMSWISVDNLGDKIQNMSRAIETVQSYFDLEGFEHLYREHGEINCVEDEEFFARVYLNHVIYKRNNIQVTDINDNFDLVDRDVDVLGKNHKAIK